ncbi:MAG: hypothetical protein JRN20_14135 [Nitrososphaerota archaeon]|jgi:heme/copper-type cytochrome/quinol oxidase subunit 2|nr:hypothetical protein [Nitrososphaerota archaeon]
MNRNILLGIVAIVLFLAGLGVGYAVNSSSAVSTTTTTVTTTSMTTKSVTALGSTNSTYSLTLVITTNNTYNATVADQPAYYVLGPNGLQSSARISLPAHQLIKLVIVNYDDGSANLTSPQYSRVSGTQNNVENVFNNGNVNSSQGPSAINVSGGETVSNISADNIAHTFTIPQLNLNVPIPPSSIVTAYFTLSQTGTFSWFCMTLCGSGSAGDQGAMSTSGWMTGSIVAS